MLISAYVNEMDLCVSMKPTEFIYSNDAGEDYAGEPGIEVCLINYPQSPGIPQELEFNALGLARLLKVLCKQERICVVFPDKTIMLS